MHAVMAPSELYWTLILSTSTPRSKRRVACTTQPLRPTTPAGLTQPRRFSVKPSPCSSTAKEWIIPMLLPCWETLVRCTKSAASTGRGTVYERAATLVGACPDNGDAELAQLRLQALSDWGRLLRRQGQYTQAAAVIRRALTFAEQRFGAESLQPHGP